MRCRLGLKNAVCFFSLVLSFSTGALCEQRQNTTFTPAPVYDNLDGSNWEECLRVDPVFCPTVLKAAIEQMEKDGKAVPAEMRELSIRHAPADVMNMCQTLGQVIQVSIPDCDIFSTGSQQVLYHIGAEDCNGRCGAGCPSGAPDCVDSEGVYRYTVDCIVHDACGDTCGLTNLDCDIIFPQSADDCFANDIDCCDAYSTRDGPLYWTEPPTQSDMPVENFCSQSRCGPCLTGEGECTSSMYCAGTRICEPDSPFNTCSEWLPVYVLEDGPYRIQQLVNGRYVDAHETAADDYRMMTRTLQDNSSQKWFLTLQGVSNFLPVYTIRHMLDDRFADAYTQSGDDYQMVTRPEVGSESQMWVVQQIDWDAATGAPICTFQHGSNARYADAWEDADHDYSLVTRLWQSDNTQKWILSFLPGSLSFTADAYVVGERDGVAAIAVVRTSPAEGQASVQCGTADGSATAPGDYTATTQTLEWADGESGTKLCMVTVHVDWEDEGDETVSLSLTGAVTAVMGPQSTATLTIVNQSGVNALDFTGDFNGDTFTDLAVGTPGEAISGFAGAGSIHALHGGALGLTTDGQTRLHQDSGEVSGGCEEGDRFGAALAVGDFNGDGYSDLAVGAPNEAIGSLTDAGAVIVLYGTAGGGLTDVGSQFWEQGNDPGHGIGLDDTEIDDRFGQALAVGDFNNDGFDDLAIGAPGEDGAYVNQGSVIVLYGTSGDGLVADETAELWWSWTGVSVSENEMFGNALAVGDFDDDGYDDLAIGSPGHVPDGTTSAGGGVSVKYGSVGRLSSEDVIFDQEALSFAANEDGDRFGDALAAGDFNGDGRDDLAIGVSKEDIGTVVDAGGLAVLYSDGNGLSTAGAVGPNQGQLPSGDAELDDSFGSVLASADFNSDGYADLVVGVPLEDVDTAIDAGVVHIIPGSSTGLDTGAAWTMGQDMLQNAAVTEAGDRFGSALAAGDFNRDYRGDLAIGVPGKDVGGFADAGRVYVIYGTATGLGTDNDTYDMCSNISGDCQVDSVFGAALASSASPNYLFADGFEWDGTGRWSATVP